MLLRIPRLKKLYSRRLQASSSESFEEINAVTRTTWSRFLGDGPEAGHPGVPVDGLLYGLGPPLLPEAGPSSTNEVRQLSPSNIAQRPSNLRLFVSSN